MNKKSLAYSAVLLLSLVVVAILLNQGLVQGVEKNADIALSVPGTSSTSGDTITFTGVLTFPDTEEVFIHQVALVAAGPGTQDLDTALPLEEIVAADLSGAPGVTGDLFRVTVSFTNLLVPPGSTLPGSSLRWTPSSGQR